MRLLATGTLLLLVATVQAAPPFPMPKLNDVMQGSLTDRAQIRWSKVVDGKRVWILITGGEATRLEPLLSDKPGHLKYDLTKNRELEKTLKASHLGSPNARRPSERPDDRTLEILAEGPQDFVVVGTWVMPLRAWKKKKPELTELLEPLFGVQAEVFGEFKGAQQ